jgi:hypothetical protein
MVGFFYMLPDTGCLLTYMQASDIVIVVSAFGMGIDKADIRR